MMVGMVLFWGVILALAIWGVNILFPSQREPEPDPDREVASLEVLSARYARGEITREQFDLLRRDLEADESSQHLSSSAGLVVRRGGQARTEKDLERHLRESAQGGEQHTHHHRADPEH